MSRLPNILTLFRIGLIPFLAIAYYIPFESSNSIATIVFLLAAISDFFDGWLARKYQITSAFGAFLDPVADKLIVATALIILVSDPQIHNQIMFHYSIFSFAVCVIIGREITISALREWMSELGERQVISVHPLGKFKTTSQMLAIAFLLYQDKAYGINTLILGEVLLYVASVLTIWSMVHYLKAARPHLNIDS